MSQTINVPALKLQVDPPIYMAVIDGRWLLKHSRAEWRSQDPEKGFQRIVREDRARQIAAAVLDKKRMFPNAIILATDKKNLELVNGKLCLDGGISFLVVDGQHRLWAQTHSTFEASYACVIHTGLDRVEMAKLFLEINDTQKRVPSSLRWDLVRLVRPEYDHHAITAVELIFELSNAEESPLYRKIDLTGEAPDNTVNQGSLAPEIKQIVSKKGLLRDADFKDQLQVLILYFAAIKSLDGSGWENGQSPFYKARVLRVLIRLLPEIIVHLKVKKLSNLKMADLLRYLKKIERTSLDAQKIKAQQGTAGMKAIYEAVKKQIF